jgi:hypothetical protein
MRSRQRAQRPLGRCRLCGPKRVRADGARVHADAAIYPLGNSKTDATVRLSHRRPSSHRSRPSVLVRPFDNPGYILFFGLRHSFWLP